MKILLSVSLIKLYNSTHQPYIPELKHILIFLNVFLPIQRCLVKSDQISKLVKEVQVKPSASLYIYSVSVTLKTSIGSPLISLIAVNMVVPCTLQSRLQFQFITIKLQFKLKLQFIIMLS